MLCRFAILAVILLLSRLAAGEEPEMVVPVDVQMAVFLNVMKLDRNLDLEHGMTIAIVYQQEYRASVRAKDDAMAAIEGLQPGIRAVAIACGTQERLRGQLADVAADVIYVTPLRAIDPGEIGVIARRRGLRTFTGVPAYVDRGIAVGVALRRNRPLILINLAAARAEGAAFSSQLLRLARIVGPS